MEFLCSLQIMVRVKDAELQKLRSQVKNLENNLQRTEEVSISVFVCMVLMHIKV